MLAQVRLLAPCDGESRVAVSAPLASARKCRTRGICPATLPAQSPAICLPVMDGAAEVWACSPNTARLAPIRIRIPRFFIASITVAEPDSRENLFFDLTR